MSLQEERIVNLYINGRKSCADIAKIDGRSEGTIYNILKRHKANFRDRSEANQTYPDYVLIYLYNLGLSCTQVGKLLGIHPTTIVKRFESISFPLRPKGVAYGIKYSNEEFFKYFYNEIFLNHLLVIKLATGGDLSNVID